MSNKIRIAMLGCGAVADLYLPAFKYLQDAGLCAVIDIEADNAGEMAGKYAVPKTYNDIARAVDDDDIDAVIVGTPPELHADLIRWWTGNDIIEVSATIRSVHPGRPAEDACVAVLEHENGMFSYHHMTRISYGREHSQDTYRIYGTQGTLVVRNDHHFPTMSLESPEIILYRPGQNTQRFETVYGWNIDDVMIQNYPFFNQLRAFVNPSGIIRHQG